MTKNKNKNTTAEIVVVLDKSGSMESVRKDTIGSFNRFLSDQKELTKDTNITVITFADNAEVIYSGDVKNAPALSVETYAPSGSTALNDAVFQGIMYLRTKKPRAAVMCIITDGEENSSKYANINTLRTLISESECNEGWKFVYLGANVDAFKVGTGYGLSGLNTFNFAQTAGGLRGMSNAASASTQSYLSSYGNSTASVGKLEEYETLLKSSNATTGNVIK